MTAKTILALAQAHRKEPSRKNYVALAEAVRALISERDGLLEIVKVAIDERDHYLRERDALRTAIAKLRSAKGRYHTQLAACDLFDAVGLPNERPVK